MKTDLGVTVMSFLKCWKKRKLEKAKKSNAEK